MVEAGPAGILLHLQSEHHQQSRRLLRAHDWSRDPHRKLSGKQRQQQSQVKLQRVMNVFGEPDFNRSSDCVVVSLFRSADVLSSLHVFHQAVLSVSIAMEWEVVM